MFTTSYLGGGLRRCSEASPRERVAPAKPAREQNASEGSGATMQRHFHEELAGLRQTLLAMGGLCEEQIRRVMRALMERDDALAQEVINRDRQVNAYDVEV